MLGERRPSDPVPERLRDHHRRCERLEIRIDEPASVQQHLAMDLRVQGVDQPRADVGDAVRQLHALHHAPDDAAGVTESEPLRYTGEPLVEIVEVDRCAVLVGDRDHDRRRPSAEAVGLLGLELPLVLRDRDDRGEGADRDRDADQAQQHPELVDTDLRPGVGQRAEEPAHAPTPFAAGNGGSTAGAWDVGAAAAGSEAAGTAADSVDASKARRRSASSSRPASSR